MDFYIGFNMMIKSALAIVADKFFVYFCEDTTYYNQI